MKFQITIDTATLGTQPIKAICTILQNQAEKLMRWTDVTEWSDTLCNSDGKAVGHASLVAPNEPLLHPTFQAIFDQFMSPPASPEYQSIKSGEVTHG